MTATQEGLLALLEMTQHRLVVDSVSEIQADLVSDSDGAQKLREWVGFYQKRVCRVFPDFNSVKSWEKPEIENFTYDRSLFHSQRYQFVEVVLELIMLMAPGRFNKELSHE